MRRFFTWFSKQWFLLVCLALFTSISLLPKIPLYDLIPGYIVRVRIEDLLLTLVLGIFVYLWARGRVRLETPITPFVILYIGVGILSILSAIFVVRTVPYDMLHIGKMILHLLRRLEYLALFYLFFNAIRSFRHVKMVLVGTLCIMVGITIFGYGQKYLYWPVYSTMNREFSKGMRLVLTEHARVPSTFGGHYDMSAYMMFMLTIALALIFLSRNPAEKILITLVYVAGFWLLILGSSRSSFLSYLLAVGILILLIGAYRRSLWWTVSRGMLVFTFSLGVMMTLGDLSSRFSQLGVVKQIQSSLAVILRPARERPDDVIAIDPLDKTDQRPVPAATIAPSPGMGGVTSATPSPTKTLPPDVYVDIPDVKTITSTESGKPVLTVVEVPREFSQCTYEYGLSACIRYETLWPRAINGFIRNPLVGSGPSTLTKEYRDQFTEAESTDNDFLRTLGEVGILGAIALYGPLVLFFHRALQALGKEQRALTVAVLFGIIAGTIGMLLNALYIDVFAASKVAFMYYAMLGVGFAVLELVQNNTLQNPRKTRKGQKF